MLLTVHVPGSAESSADDLYLLYHNGSDFVVHRDHLNTPQETCQIFWGVLTPTAFSALTSALSAGQVGELYGSCATSDSPSGPASITVVWYGQNGRMSSFTYDADDQSRCSDGIQLIASHAIPSVLAASSKGQFLIDCPLTQ